MSRERDSRFQLENIGTRKDSQYRRRQEIPLANSSETLGQSFQLSPIDPTRAIPPAAQQALKLRLFRCVRLADLCPAIPSCLSQLMGCIQAAPGLESSSVVVFLLGFETAQQGLGPNRPLTTSTPS